MKSNPVVYAEDEENDAFFLQRAFNLAGISQPLIVVANGQEAIDYCSGTGRFTDRAEYPTPCLLLLDLNLPLKSGLDVLQWIREKSSVSTLRVIMFTSSRHDRDIHRAYLQGASAYLVKPAKSEELNAIAKAIKDFWLTYNQVPQKFDD
jgi:DNA-binding response OmpR family regulator